MHKRLDSELDRTHDAQSEKESKIGYAPPEITEPARTSHSNIKFRPEDGPKEFTRHAISEKKKLFTHKSNIVPDADLNQLNQPKTSPANGAITEQASGSGGSDPTTVAQP